MNQARPSRKPERAGGALSLGARPHHRRRVRHRRLPVHERDRELARLRRPRVSYFDGRGRVGGWEGGSSERANERRRLHTYVHIVHIIHAPPHQPHSLQSTSQHAAQLDSNNDDLLLPCPLLNLGYHHHHYHHHHHHHLNHFGKGCPAALRCTPLRGTLWCPTSTTSAATRSSSLPP